jgi:AraC-like DNA-binding protein
MPERQRAGDEALAELASAIGEPLALALSQRFGGTRLYVPRRISDGHPICVALGREGAERLAAYAGGGELAVPKQAARRARVIALHSRGALTMSQIALETAYSERHVYRLVRDAIDRSQPSLFDDL